MIIMKYIGVYVNLEQSHFDKYLKNVIVKYTNNTDTIVHQL